MYAEDIAERGYIEISMINYVYIYLLTSPKIVYTTPEIFHQSFQCTDMDFTA
jgi:hypothetical protein